jgi:hypothetical protein
MLNNLTKVLMKTIECNIKQKDFYWIYIIKKRTGQNQFPFQWKT